MALDQRFYSGLAGLVCIGMGLFGAYLLQHEQGARVDFTSLFQSIEALPDGRSRTVRVAKDVPIRPRKLLVYPEYCLGDFCRLRMVDRMRTMDIDGKEEMVQFDQGRKPTDDTAILIGYRCNEPVLYVQEHENALTAARIARYFGELRAN
jgi:hypothetical protein